MQTLPLLHPSIPPGLFDLNQLLEYEPPVRWRPEPGERIQGVLHKVDVRRSFGQAAPTLFVMVPPHYEDEHQWRYLVVRASGVVLRGAVKALNPKVGEEVAALYTGMRETADGAREYAHYQFAVRRDGRWLS
jgi:hypothetical protein